jgi:membrane protein implicated in regulation of membrane protease activity
MQHDLHQLEQIFLWSLAAAAFFLFVFLTHAFGVVVSSFVYFVISVTVACACVWLSYPSVEHRNSSSPDQKKR